MSTVLNNSVDQFWRDVINAHDLIATNHELELDVERNGRTAKIRYVELGNGIILITVGSANTETTEALHAP
jgi:hypothetical protein